MKSKVPEMANIMLWHIEDDALDFEATIYDLAGKMENERNPAVLKKISRRLCQKVEAYLVALGGRVGAIRLSLNPSLTPEQWDGEWAGYDRRFGGDASGISQKKIDREAKEFLSIFEEDHKAPPKSKKGKKKTTATG